MKIVHWIARISALIILLFLLPFYFGYGNPLPFTNPDYSLWENVALLAVPFIILGLVLGWRYEKIGGLLIVVSMAIAFLIGLLTDANLSINLIFPILPGILYLISGFASREGEPSS